jgi:Uncharacterised protein family UPF0547/FHA domain
MSTDKNDISFMRCPSCKSLVPTASKKCRMCGFVFENSVDSTAEDNSLTSGRVRQRTVSRSREEILAALEKNTESVSPELESEEFDSEQFGSDQDTDFVEEEEQDSVSEFDPSSEELSSQNIRETEEDSDIQNDSDESASNFNDSLSDSETDESSDDNDESSLEEEYSEKLAEVRLSGEVEDESEDDRIAVVSQDQNQVSSLTDTDKEDDNLITALKRGSINDEKPELSSSDRYNEKSEYHELATLLSNSPTETASNFDNTTEKDEQVYVESIADTDLGESIIIPTDTPVKDESAAQDIVSATYQEQEEVIDDSLNQFKEQSNDVLDSSVNSEVLTSNFVEELKAVLPSDTKPVDLTATLYQKSNVNDGAMFIMDNNSEQVLVGWFVCFDDPKRKSIEIRGNKFFVTKTQIRSGDLVVDNDSVSSPHALVKVIDGGKVYLQDLLSEQGSSFKDPNSTEYNPVTDGVTISSGSFIKLGKAEFLLVMIPPLPK